MRNNVKTGHKSQQSYANTRTTGKEQYYTNEDVVDICLEEVQKHINLDGKTILEPCGGTGEFIEGLRRLGIPDNKIISYDIEPMHPMVKRGSYLEQDFSKMGDLVSITNPPFGRMSKLAKKFFAHATTHSEYICYLVPRSWRKWTTQNSLDENYHLIADIDMPKNCFYLPNNETTKKDVLNTVFQIWQRKDTKRTKIAVPDNGLIKKIIPKLTQQEVHRKIKETLYRKVNGQFEEVKMDTYNQVVVRRPDYITGANFQIVQFGHSCGACKDITEHRVQAKTTTMYLHIDRDDVKAALRTIDFSKYYKNVSYVSALSIQEINYELNEWFGLPNFKFT